MPWTQVNQPQSGSGGWTQVKPPSGAPQGLAADSGTDPSATHPNVAAAVHLVADAVPKLLDAQRFGLAKAVSGKGSTDDQMTELRKHIPVLPIPDLTHGGRVYHNFDEAYHAMGNLRLPAPNVGNGEGIDIGHPLQGASDTMLQTITDPLTYETLGAGPLLKATGLGAKLTPAAMKAMTSTALGRKLYDVMNYGGEVSRTLGPEVKETVHGASNYASATGSRVEAHLNRRFDEITKPLPPQSITKVGKALNGDIPAELPFDMENPATLNPAEKSAYRQLRALTELDYKLRTDTARTIAMKAYASDLNPADRATLEAALKRDKAPEIPKPEQRVRIPNQARTDLANRSRALNESASTTNVPPEILAARERALDELNPERVTLNAGPLDKAVEGTKPVTLPPVKPRFTFQPANKAAIDHATMLRDRFDKIQRMIEEKVPKREQYMPWAHPKGVEEDREAFSVSPKDYYDPRTEHREDIQVFTPEDVKRGFAAMASNTGRQVATRVIHESLGDLLDQPAVEKLLTQSFKATGAKLTDWEKIKEGWKALVGYPRAATVSITPRHAANILDLLTNTVPPQHLPQVMKDTMTLAGQLVKATPKQYAALTKEGRELGALSGDFAEHHPFFQNFPESKLLGPLSGKSTGGLAAWTRANNKLVWAVDTAAKQTYAKLLVGTGEASGLRAGAKAAERLVDYEHVSDVQKALRYIAPFGTFRGALPGAVLGGIARNPARAALYSRMTGGTMYGAEPAPGEHGPVMYNPTADVGRGVDNPMEFLRGTLGAPTQAAAVLASEGLSGNLGASVKTIGQEVQDLPGTLAKAPEEISQGHLPQLIPKPRNASQFTDQVALRKARYLNYGNPIDLRWLASAAASGIVEARTALEEMGYGQFKAKPGSPEARAVQEAIYQTTGVRFR